MNSKIFLAPLLIASLFFFSLFASSSVAEAQECDLYSVIKNNAGEIITHDLLADGSISHEDFAKFYTVTHFCAPIASPPSFEHPPAAPTGAYGTGYLQDPDSSLASSLPGDPNLLGASASSPDTTGVGGTGGAAGIAGGSSEVSGSDRYANVAGNLAYTGSETTRLAFLGIGLIGYGAAAMGIRRKFFQ